VLARRKEISRPCVKVGPLPDIIGQVVILTVSDANRSAALYCDLLSTQETSRYASCLRGSPWAPRTNRTIG